MSGRNALMADESPNTVTEAVAMARAAITGGVRESDLLLEEVSRDTIGNAYFSARRILEPNGWNTVRVVTSDYHVPRAAWVFNKVLGAAFDVSFSPASSEAFARSIAQRAQQEAAIAQFLMEWIGALPDGDRSAIDEFIAVRHPAYGSAPTITTAEIDARVDEIGRGYRDEARRPRGNRTLQERDIEL